MQLELEFKELGGRGGTAVRVFVSEVAQVGVRVGGGGGGCRFRTGLGLGLGLLRIAFAIGSGTSTLRLRSRLRVRIISIRSFISIIRIQNEALPSASGFGNPAVPRIPVILVQDMPCNIPREDSDLSHPNQYSPPCQHLNHRVIKLVLQVRR